MSQRGYYDKKATGFDRGLLYRRNNRNHRKKIEKICELLDLDGRQAGARVLEIGTGTGIHAEYLLARYPAISYAGIDVSQGMLKEAEKKLERRNIYLVAGDGHRLPFKDCTFDAVFISGTLHHLRDPCAAIAEVLRVLKAGGKLAIMEPNWLFPTNFLPAILNEVERGILKMTPGNFDRWAAATGLSTPVTGHMLYTPPAPVAMAGVYDTVDDMLMRIPGISKVSIMIYMAGVKQK